MGTHDNDDAAATGVDHMIVHMNRVHMNRVHVGGDKEDMEDMEDMVENMVAAAHVDYNEHIRSVDNLFEEHMIQQLDIGCMAYVAHVACALNRYNRLLT